MSILFQASASRPRISSKAIIANRAFLPSTWPVTWTRHLRSAAAGPLSSEDKTYGGQNTGKIRWKHASSHDHGSEKMGPSNSKYLSIIAIFHFHDYGSGSSDQWTALVISWLRKGVEENAVDDKEAGNPRLDPTWGHTWASPQIAVISMQVWWNKGRDDSPSTFLD